ncbi:MAG: hypothetical protein HY904_15420 [Deltaproteobacteria bacterium]|nr:hypothetical protein [Deltaproteobacteria bacterium]
MPPRRGHIRLLAVAALLLVAGAPARAQGDDDVVDPGGPPAATAPAPEEPDVSHVDLGDPELGEPDEEEPGEDEAEEAERPRRRARDDDREDGGRDGALTRDPKVLALLAGLGSGATALAVHLLTSVGIGYLAWLAPWLGACAGGGLGGVVAWLLAALLAHRRVPLGRLALTTALTGWGVAITAWGLSLIVAGAAVAIPLVGAVVLVTAAPETGWMAFGVAYLAIYAVPGIYVLGSTLGAVSAAVAAGVAGGLTAMLTGRRLEEGEDLLNFDLFEVPEPDGVEEDG